MTVGTMLYIIGQVHISKLTTSWYVSLNSLSYIIGKGLFSIIQFTLSYFAFSMKQIVIQQIDIYIVPYPQSKLYCQTKIKVHVH